jgi:hypothetical protein
MPAFAGMTHGGPQPAMQIFRQIDKTLPSVKVDLQQSFGVLSHTPKSDI